MGAREANLPRVVNANIAIFAERSTVKGENYRQKDTRAMRSMNLRAKNRDAALLFNVMSNAITTTINTAKAMERRSILELYSLSCADSGAGSGKS
jgi:hypothetical protein